MIVISGKNCGICFAVKKVLKDKNIPFEEYDITNEKAKPIITESGMKELPIVKMDDGTFCCGMEANLLTRKLPKNE